MKITIEQKTVYGNILFYPGCEQSKLLAKLANKKTLTRSDINIIKALGYEINIISKTEEV